MPIHTYHCENCGLQFDTQQKYDEAPLRTCPECREKALRKVYHPVGIVFKGSGFYTTDHRHKSSATIPPKTETASEDSPQKAESEKKEKADEKSKTKPAASKEAAKSD